MVYGFQSLVVVSDLAAVTNQVHATDDLANSEETNHLGGGDTDQSELLGASVADTGEEVCGRDVQGLQGSRVAGSVDQRLEVGLESGQVTEYQVRIKWSERRVQVRNLEANIRRSHVLATENQLAELETDTGVVDGGGNHS